MSRVHYQESAVYGDLPISSRVTENTNSTREDLEFYMKSKPTITTISFPSAFITERDVLFMEAHNICSANSKLREEHQLPHILVGINLFVCDRKYFPDKTLHRLTSSANCFWACIPRARYTRIESSRDLCGNLHYSQFQGSNDQEHV